MFITKLAGAVLAGLLLSGCIAVPIPVAQKAPFQDEAKPKLEVQESTRADVLFELGEPKFVFDNERLFVYTATQTHFVWFVAFAAGYTGDAGILPGSWTNHFLGIWFDDNNRVSHVEAIPLREHAIGDRNRRPETHPAVPSGKKNLPNCYSNGVCLATIQGDAVYAPPPPSGPEAGAPANACRLVVFVDFDADAQENSGILLSHLRVSLNGKYIGPQKLDGYYAFELPPGRHTVSAVGLISSLWNPGEAADIQRIGCEPGKTTYLRIALGRKGARDPKVSIERVGPEKAFAPLAPRRRLLELWHPNNFPARIRPSFL